MKEGLTIPREQLGSLRRVEPNGSYSQEVANELSQTCIGQEEAMSALARSITLAETGMNDPDRPLRVLLLAGKTGTGKTEASHAVAKHWFGDRNSEQLKIIDCTEYQERHMKARFTGSPPGYIGYNDEPVLTEDFLAKRNIIVLDEFEKAHPEFHKLWLPVFEDARMNVKKGDPLNFNNSLIILTSNAGAEEMQEVGSGNQRIGFGSAENDKGLGLEKVAQKAIKERFKDMPELLGRIDQTIVFKDLSPENYEQIFDKFLTEKNHSIAERLKENAPFFATTQEFKQFILSSIDTTYGARDLRGTLERELFHKAADLFMGEDLTGRPLVADREENETVFYTDNLDSPLLPERPIPEPEPEPEPETEPIPEEPEEVVIYILPEESETPEPPIRRPHKQRKYPKQPRQKK